MSEKQRLDAMLGGDDVTEELLVQNAAAALTEITHCAAVTVNTAPKFSVISKVEVIPTGKRLYVILLITSSGNIKNKACRLEFDLNHEQLEFFRHYIEENLNGVSVSELSDEMFDKMVAALSTYMVSLSPLVKGICELSEDLRHQELTVRGGEKLLSCDDLDKMEVKLGGNGLSIIMLTEYMNVTGSDKYVKLCQELGIEYNDHFPVTETRPFEYNLNEFTAAWRTYFQNYMRDRELDSDISAPLLVAQLRERI